MLFVKIQQTIGKVKQDMTKDFNASVRTYIAHHSEPSERKEYTLRIDGRIVDESHHLSDLHEQIAESLRDVVNVFGFKMVFYAEDEFAEGFSSVLVWQTAEHHYVTRRFVIDVKTEEPAQHRFGRRTELEAPEERRFGRKAEAENPEKPSRTGGRFGRKSSD